MNNVCSSAKQIKPGKTRWVYHRAASLEREAKVQRWRAAAGGGRVPQLVQTIVNGQQPLVHIPLQSFQRLDILPVQNYQDQSAV